MAAYDLYGSNLSLAEAKNVLEGLLMLQFEARDSEYKNGEYFYAGNISGEDFELRQNVDPYDRDPVEIKFPQFSTLLYINATSRSEKLKEIVGPASGDFFLLRHEDF